MPFRRVIPAICLFALTAAPALADDTTAALRKAEALYRQGHLGKTFMQLEAAATSIARRLAGRYAKTFPPAPRGWRAQPVRSSIDGKAWAGRTLRLARTYVRTGQDGSATAELMADTKLIIAAIKSLKASPANARRTGRTIVPIKGAGDASIKFDTPRGVGDIYVFVADRFYVTIRARNVRDPRFLTRMLSTWDFAALKKAAALD